jgi:hypothetical protein
MTHDGLGASAAVLVVVLAAAGCNDTDPPHVRRIGGVPVTVWVRAAVSEASMIRKRHVVTVLLAVSTQVRLSSTLDAWRSEGFGRSGIGSVPG